MEKYQKSSINSNPGLMFRTLFYITQVLDGEVRKQNGKGQSSTV